MEKWKEFLISLRTGGGRIAILTLLALFFALLVTNLVYFPPLYEKAADAIIPILALIVGALVAALRGDAPKIGPPAK